MKKADREFEMLARKATAPSRGAEKMFRARLMLAQGPKGPEVPTTSALENYFREMEAVKAAF